MPVIDGSPRTLYRGLRQPSNHSGDQQPYSPVMGRDPDILGAPAFAQGSEHPPYDHAPREPSLFEVLGDETEEGWFFFFFFFLFYEMQSTYSLQYISPPIHFFTIEFYLKTTHPGDGEIALWLQTVLFSRKVLLLLLLLVAVDFFLSLLTPRSVAVAAVGLVLVVLMLLERAVVMYVLRGLFFRSAWRGLDALVLVFTATSLCLELVEHSSGYEDHRELDLDTNSRVVRQLPLVSGSFAGLLIRPLVTVLRTRLRWKELSTRIEEQAESARDMHDYDTSLLCRVYLWPEIWHKEKLRLIPTTLMLFAESMVVPFACLLAVPDSFDVGPGSRPVLWAWTVGSTMSLIGVFMLMGTFASNREVRNSSLQLVLSLGVADACFRIKSIVPSISALADHSNAVETGSPGCFVLASLGHFFAVSALLWNASNSVNLCLLLRFPMKRRPLWSFHASVWGWAAVLTIPVLAAGDADVRMDGLCSFRGWGGWLLEATAVVTVFISLGGALYAIVQLDEYEPGRRTMEFSLAFVCSWGWLGLYVFWEELGAKQMPPWLLISYILQVGMGGVFTALVWYGKMAQVARDFMNGSTRHSSGAQSSLRRFHSPLVVSGTRVARNSTLMAGSFDSNAEAFASQQATKRSAQPSRVTGRARLASHSMSPSQVSPATMNNCKSNLAEQSKRRSLIVQPAYQ